MATKHTPGPWDVLVRRGGMIEVAASHNCTVASMYVPVVGCRDANARLIAAAPDLLEVLRVLAAYPVEEFSLERKPERKLFGANDWELMVSHVLAARSAIAKATEVPA